MTKGILSCMAVLLLSISPLHAFDFWKQRQTPYKTVPKTKRNFGKNVRKFLARVTVYWSHEDRYSRRHRTSTGVRLQRGVVAVDPRRIPYGSQIKFPDGVCRALDTGTAVKTRKAARRIGRTLEEKTALVVDRFFETKHEALAWASRNPPFMSLELVFPWEHL